MKKTRNFFMTIVMAFVMLFAAFAPFVGVNKKQASALSPDYTGGASGVIYYFCDLYPSIDYQTLMDTYQSNGVILDRQPVTKQEFASLISNNYFSGFGEGCVVVIDIKTFDPTSVWGSLFAQLSSQGCKTVSVTSYTFSANSGADVQHVCQMYRLKDFTSNAVKNIRDTVNGEINIKNINILIDGNFVDVNTYYCYDMQSLCDVSPFVRFLMEAFGDCIGGGSDYDGIAQDLSELNIRLLVDAGNGTYVDIISWNYYTIPLPSDGFSTFGMGCFALDNNFYNDLYNVQSNGGGFPVYIMEGDPFNFSSPGLAVITEWTLVEMYGSEGDEVAPAIDAINSLLN